MIVSFPDYTQGSLSLFVADSFCFPNGDVYMDIFYPDAYENMERNFWAMGGFTAATILLAMIIFKIRGVPNLH